MQRQLATLLREAAAGRPPPSDGAVEVVPSPHGRTDAVVAFTAHTVIAADIDPQEVADQLPVVSLSAPMSPTFLAWLGRRLRSDADSLDVVLAATGATRGAGELVPVEGLEHARLARAALPNRCARLREG